MIKSTARLINFAWMPLFGIFASIEYQNVFMCGSRYVTGSMWFMWLMMSLASSRPYIKILVDKLHHFEYYTNFNQDGKDG